MNFLHWLTTSRYTRALEQQISDLKQEKGALNQRIRELESAMIPALRTIEREKNSEVGGISPVTRKAGQTIQKAVKEAEQSGVKIERMPPTRNWLQAKDRLEYASDETGARFERAVNGHKEL